MAVEVIDAKALKDLIEMFEISQETVMRLARENADLKARKLLTVAEVAKITGYTDRTIREKKFDIGFVTEGKDIRFKLADIDKRIESDYIRPRKRKQPKHYSLNYH